MYGHEGIGVANEQNEGFHGENEISMKRGNQGFHEENRAGHRHTETRMLDILRML